MAIHIRNILAPEAVKDMRGQLSEAQWGGGRQTAGYLSSRVKESGMSFSSWWR